MDSDASRAWDRIRKNPRSCSKIESRAPSWMAPKKKKGKLFWPRTLPYLPTVREGRDTLFILGGGERGKEPGNTRARPRSSSRARGKLEKANSLVIGERKTMDPIRNDDKKERGGYGIRKLLLFFSREGGGEICAHPSQKRGGRDLIQGKTSDT